MLTCTLVQFHNSNKPDQTYNPHELSRPGLRTAAIGVDVALRDKVLLGFGKTFVLLLELFRANAGVFRTANRDYKSPERLDVCNN